MYSIQACIRPYPSNFRLLAGNALEENSVTRWKEPTVKIIQSNGYLPKQE
jgi:hypothetical protein